ncbi:hypothetical protein HUK65_05375 [Rhodobacteraceae bacterium 2376]|uniref:Uncharacterized protein n=1 Tax=Rhabdonatronobacter sediminivivens TaxID=2743469 RepID=A0A7Z0HY29_9RHOB|nr:hypothetical protein [Rhabdonatronobacter sediminivivens]NYS24416.1 hypothetical protein [Rhabdonatronobacter sediminivivens]
MAIRVVFRDGDHVPAFPVEAGGQTLVMVPFAKDDVEDLHVVATACSLMVPGEDQVRELSLELLIYDPATGGTYTYSLHEALERLPADVWLPFCLATSFAVRKLLSLEKLETFHIYTQAYRHDSQLAAMLSVVANTVQQEYKLLSVDEYLGSVLWIGTLKNEREASDDSP